MVRRATARLKDQRNLSVFEAGMSRMSGMGAAGHDVGDVDHGDDGPDPDAPCSQGRLATEGLLRRC